jgi:hypothetical protein
MWRHVAVWVASHISRRRSASIFTLDCLTFEDEGITFVHTARSNKTLYPTERLSFTNITGLENKPRRAEHAYSNWGEVNLKSIRESPAKESCTHSRMWNAIQAHDSVVGIVSRLRITRSEVRIPTGTRDVSLLQNAQTCSGAHLASFSEGTDVLFRGQSGRGVKLTNHVRLIPRFRISGHIPLLPTCLHVVDSKSFCCEQSAEDNNWT